ncbi:hypothetical protein F4679DRAFT_562197 [Xylaria curta]|nr:hypothetical protein F4679DRAFT_562197 [Xylaria curta]
MGVKHDTVGSSLSYGATKAMEYNNGFKDLSGGPPSREVKESTSILDTLHREIPVHVTKQTSRAFDAETPPSNRQRAVQPPGDGGAEQPGDNGANDPFGNGGGGGRDRENGSGGGGSGPSTLRQTTDHRPVDKSMWRWNCSNCSFQNLSYNHDISCPGCHHRRDSDDGVWAIRRKIV